MHPFSQIVWKWSMTVFKSDFALPFCLPELLACVCKPPVAIVWVKCQYMAQIGAHSQGVVEVG